MKLFNKLLAAAMISTAFTAAPLAAETFEAPPSAVVSATPQGDGYQIAWSEPVQVSVIEIYYGHGTRGGFVSRVNVGAAKSINVPANATRFNLVAPDGRFLHLECGGNDRTSMPQFRGVSVDCSFTGASGQAEGALVIVRG